MALRVSKKSAARRQRTFLRQNLARNDFTLAFSDVLIFALVAG
ncbi:Hypothetical protein LDBND_1672 [Lactobacillus delbrueckii subsp. bulgaricus ND02]|nr:Hypothetical protein LDBND_1672 [Lactobacillus delbrueckii subsp. bulgaricus ND02]